MLNQLNLPLQLLLESDVIMGMAESHLFSHLTPRAFCLLPKAVLVTVVWGAVGPSWCSFTGINLPFSSVWRKASQQGP